MSRLGRLIRRTPLHLVVIAICVFWMLPTFGLLISSVRTPAAVGRSGWWTVLAHPFNLTQYTLQNYREVLLAEGMAKAFRNSLIITIPGTALPITVAAFAAFAFAWMDFAGRRLLFMVVVGLLVIPLQMTLIPVLRLYTKVGLTGTFVGIWFAHSGYGLPLQLYLMRNFFDTLPRELFESAFLDGASWFTAFRYVALPLSVPAFASVAIFQFLWVWNDLLVALVYLGGTEAVAPLTLKLSSLVNQMLENWELLTAAAFVSMVVPVMVFFALQRYFVRGILAGSVKG